MLELLMFLFRRPSTSVTHQLLSPPPSSPESWSSGIRRPKLGLKAEPGKEPIKDGSASLQADSTAENSVLTTNTKMVLPLQPSL